MIKTDNFRADIIHSITSVFIKVNNDKNNEVNKRAFSNHKWWDFFQLNK